MKNLMVLQNKELTIDSREISEMIEKEHSKLLRDIRTYIKYLGEANIGHTDYFIESSYKSEQNKDLPCYLLTKMGCEMVSNKMTGKKGVLFTAKYVKKFNELEKNQKPQLPTTYLEALKELVTSEEKRIELQEQNVVLVDENKLLTGEVLTWADRNFINALVRKYGASRGGKFGFGVAWNNFKKELLYKYGVNLNSRITYFKKTHNIKTNPKTLDMLYDDELSDAVATAIALCKDNKIEIEDIIEKFKYEK